MIQDIYCESQINDPDFFFNPDPGVKEAPDPESAILLFFSLDPGSRMEKNPDPGIKHSRSPTLQLLKF
jgi:hypothetical protein